MAIGCLGGWAKAKRFGGGGEVVGGKLVVDAPVLSGRVKIGDYYRSGGW